MQLCKEIWKINLSDATMYEKLMEGDSVIWILLENLIICLVMQSWTIWYKLFVLWCNPEQFDIVHEFVDTWRHP